MAASPILNFSAASPPTHVETMDSNISRLVTGSFVLRNLIGEADKLPEDLSPEIKLVFIVLYVIIMLVSVVGNMFVVIVITKNKKMRTVTNLFLVSLAVSDMLIASLNMPFQLKFYVQNEWTLGDFLCKFTRYLQGVFIVASILTLTGIAVDRYYAICHPLKARHVHTMTRAIVIISMFWAVSFAILIPQLFIQRIEPKVVIQAGSFPPIRIVNVCVEYFSDHRLMVVYTLTFYVFLYMLPVIIMFVTYGRIAHRLWVRRPIGDALENPQDHERRVREKKRIIKMLVTIMVLFTLCWFPFFTSTVYLLFHSTETFRVIMAFFQLIGYSNSCLNPFVYCFLNESFQQHFYQTICCSCRCRRLAKKTRSEGLSEKVNNSTLNSSV